MGVTPLTFSGQSSYASDFQAILTRAVSIANIPLEQLQNEGSTNTSKVNQLGQLGSAVGSLTSAVQALGALAASSAISATSSNSSVVSFTASGTPSAATYTVNSITSLATAASETSTSGFPNSTSTAVSADGTLQLVVGSQTYPINLTSQTNNLAGLQNAINGLNAGVTASILTTGNGDYLSVSANSLGATTLQLLDQASGTSTNILTDSNQGTNAVFTLNNLPVSRTENTINDLIPGGTLSLQATSTSPVTLTLAPDPNQLSSALQTMVSAYNSVVTQVNGQTGQSAGLLDGDPAVLQVQSAMQQLVQYQGSGSIQNLSDLGIDLNQDGTMSFDSSTFDSLSQSQIDSALQFFGSTTTGFGGLSQTLNDISAPLTGSIADEQGALDTENTNLETQITNTTASINTMQQTLLQQLSQADTLITSLTSQQSQLSASIESLDYVSYGQPLSSS